MPLDPALLKIRWGVTDPALDVLVQDIADQAQGLAETYTGRRFDLQADMEDFSNVVRSLQVRRFPIEAITAIWYWQLAQMPEAPPQGTGVISYRLDAGAGLVWPGPNPCTWPGVLHIEYSGGFAKWPADLTWAVTTAADLIWSETPGGGAPVGSTAGALGPLRKLSVTGVYTAEYDTVAQAVGAGGGDGDNTWGILTPQITAVLDRYSIAAVIGIG
jgi:hypothetical protein